MKKSVLLPLLWFSCFFSAFAQPPCPGDDELSLVVSIRTDGYGYEVGWRVTDVDGTVYANIPYNTYANNQLYQTQVCIPEDACVHVEILDSYGDGLLGAGYVLITLEGDTLANDPNYGSLYQLWTGCSPGQTCNSATPIEEGVYTTAFDDHWYSFVPDSVGTYLITTCDSNACDTKIWVYENCGVNAGDEDNAGTAFFDDNDGGCAPQAEVRGFLAPGVTYYIRIGDNQNACGDAITWELRYLGPVTGCTDPTSCNYNPLATIDDGSCLPQGHPDCPAGPDLLMRQDILASSIQLGTVNSTDPCLIEEGCMRGYGPRQVVRFSTRIDNIGEKDYFIGQPSFTNTQFTWNNCHNHFHYDGYAEYVLFSEAGERIPAGFKNGFCVLDLGCMWGNAQYGCGFMGISAGCYDEYWSGLSCQWIDVTDIADGTYTFVTRVNWDNAPDALGQRERDSLNNWAQVCITLDRSSGTLQMTTDPNCETYRDCSGTLYGSLLPDCRGECGGTAVRGDLNENGMQEILDAEEYVNAIVAADAEASPCNDLNADGRISVYDASLLASCINFGVNHNHPGEGAHDHCNFPGGVVNVLDTVTLTIMEVNFEEGYVDVGIKNPSTRINAWQFRTSGIALSDIENSADPAVYPIAPRISMADSMAIGVSYQDSMLQRSATFQPLCRLHFSEVTADFICLSEVIDIVNERQEQTITRIEDGCVERLINSNEETPLLRPQVKVIPNPFAGFTMLEFPNPKGEVYQLDLLDASGRLLRRYEGLTGESVRIERGALPAGLYWYRLSGPASQAAGRLMAQ